MEVFTELLHERVLLRDAVATLILLLVVISVRAAALRAVRSAQWASPEIMVRWTVQVRWACILLLGLGLVVIWSAELRALALSVVAIAAALVLALKELILCVSGAVLRATSGSFTLGDRIEVGGMRGDVVDLGALTTTILEVGPTHRRTGRLVKFPNSMLLSNAVTNETINDEYVLHSLTLPVDPDDWKAAETRLLRAAREVCGPLLDDARRRFDETARRHGLPAISVEPTVTFLVPEHGKLNFLLRFPARAREKGLVEQSILRRFFEPGSNPGASAQS